MISGVPPPAGEEGVCAGEGQIHAPAADARQALQFRQPKPLLPDKLFLHNDLRSHSTGLEMAFTLNSSAS